MMFQKKLNRTGKRPLVFMGEEIASATNKHKDSTRWDDVHMYKSSNGGYIVGIARKTNWVDERDTYFAEPFNTMDNAIRFVERDENARSLVPQIRQQLNGVTQ
jgi:EXLDI family protein